MTGEEATFRQMEVEWFSSEPSLDWIKRGKFRNGDTDGKEAGQEIWPLRGHRAGAEGQVESREGFVFLLKIRMAIFPLPLYPIH